jgi:PLP dependent protein
VTLVAVSKTVPVERLRCALEADVTTFGENRVQEAAPKVAALPAARWHLVGHLQSNKAAAAVRLFEVIESVDSVALARRLDRLVGERAAEGASRRLAVYLQVNVDADPGKEGLSPDELRRSLDEILALPGIDVRGLMTVGRLVAQPADARATFQRLRALRDELRPGRPGFGTGLSMGMSDDFEMAVEEGSTLIRVGRAIFGERASTGARA